MSQSYGQPRSAPTLARPLVRSHNEWDPLEEVIVGRVDGAMVPSWTTIERTTVPPGSWEVLEETIGRAGTPYSAELVEAAEACLEELVAILNVAGVVVRRPDVIDFSSSFSTPEWDIRSGVSAANPRDVLLVVGDEIIEVPMADRGRHFETWPYRRLVKGYFESGARWTAAPKPQLVDDLYRRGYEVPAQAEEMRYVLTEFEPVFDAADVVRCGRDLFMLRSHVTNASGIRWLRRHLGDSYRVHEVESRYRRAMHIDTSLLPLAPGKVMVNPEFMDPATLPPQFDSWDVLIAPEPVVTAKNHGSLVSRWGSLNVLMLDPTRVVVERRQEPLIRAFEEWGFEPIPCSFEDYALFGGLLHCATLDVRRRGELETYL